LVELSQILNDNSIKHLTFSKSIEDAQKLVNKAKSLLNKGLEVILITLGDKGAILLENGFAYFGHVQLEREIIDTVGAGDSFLAGFIVPYYQGIETKICFKRAIAAGAASCLRMGPGILKKEDMDRLLHSVSISKIY
jgi:1-phosphofructokinase